MSESAQLERAEMPSESGKGKGIFARILLFIRQIIIEMKKVVYPTKAELTTYFTVVIVFVICIMAYVGGIDVLFRFLSSYIFGSLAK